MHSQDTFSELMLRYRGLLFSVCRRYSRDGLSVDDLLQETMVALWELREKLLSITSPPQQAAWVWRVARSTCIDMLRRTKASEPLPDNYDPPDEDPAPRRHLYELVSLLPETDRTIVTLFLEGYEYKEIAAQTGLTKNNVGIRLMRIKDKLREQWNQE